MRYNIGDRVKVRSDLEVGEWYHDGVFFAPGMEKYCGVELTVKSVLSRSYRMTDDSGKEIDWYWIDDFLENYEFKEIDVDSLADILMCKA